MSNTYFKLNEDGTLEISGSNGVGFESFDTLPRHETLAPDECKYYNKETVTVIGTEDVIVGKDADGVDIIEVQDVTESTFSVEIDYDAIQELLVVAIISEGETLVDGYIQKAVDDYNKTNGTKFSDAHSCADYKDVTGYTHQQFCIDVWAWNVAVWESARANQVVAITQGWDEATFLESLPQFGV